MLPLGLGGRRKTAGLWPALRWPIVVGWWQSGGVVTGKLPALLGGAVELLLPARCAGCGALGAGCCPRCLPIFAQPRPAPRQGLPAGMGVYSLACYSGAARAIVLAYKAGGRRDLAPALGAALAAALPSVPEARTDQRGSWWLVPVPSRPGAARTRGGQHIELLARHCARELAAGGHPCAIAPALRLGRHARDAVGLDAEARAANLASQLAVTTAGLPPAGTPVVLVDDVVTSGASLAASAAALLQRGVAVSAALTLTAAG